MNTVWIHLRAPFAAFRWMQAGVYRATSPVIPPSAAWGLVLNLAGIDIRDRGYKGAVAAVRPDAPRLELAVGSCREAEVGTLYQQLHSYPVGNSGKELAGLTHGAKFWIAPVRRELLVGFDAVLGVRGGEDVVGRVSRGLRGELEGGRYGLPFAGDNNLLFDRIEVVPEPPAARWYVPVDRTTELVGSTCRLTVSIDRMDASRTVTRLFAPTDLSSQPPPEAWVWTPTQAP